MRVHVVGNRVKYQYTKRFSADVVERVVKVPLRPNAFHDGKLTIFYAHLCLNWNIFCTDLPLQLHMNRRRYEGRLFIYHARVVQDLMTCRSVRKNGW